MLPYISYNLTLELHDHTTTQLFASVSCLLCVQSLLFIAPYIHSFLRKLSTFWPCLTTENLCPPLTPVELLCRDFGADYLYLAWEPYRWKTGLSGFMKWDCHVTNPEPLVLLLFWTHSSTLILNLTLIQVQTSMREASSSAIRYSLMSIW